jgi:hypothetical protein
MLSHYQHLVDNVRQIAILPQNVAVGPRIGGNAPEGIAPTKISNLTQYFATVRLDESAAQEVSIFVSLDDKDMSANNIYRNVSKLYSSEEFVQIVVHPMSRRSNSSCLASPLSGQALQIEAVRPDIVVAPGGELLLPSKLGGRPYFYYFDTGYIEALNQLFVEGFVLFLQMTWPGPIASPIGPWPFDEYTFHLLAKETSEGIIWRYGWG